MAEEPAHHTQKLSWRFPRAFWLANGAELCERAAYYGMFISLFRYLNTDIGFTDPQTGLITALFAGGIYFFPTFMGIMADKIGFKQALMLAFTLLTAGYAVLGAFQLRSTAVAALTLIMLGGAIIKPVISGTVAKCSDAAHRARAMSIFYMVVNIGSFSGKGLAGYLNEALGLHYINYYAAGMSCVALLLVTIFYRNVDTAGVGKTVGEALRGLWTVMHNFRFLSLILIIAGFWLIQGQLYGAMPTFIERVLGKGYKPEWLANINPLTVVLLVVPITHLVRRFRPENAIGIGLLIIPFTALTIALGSALSALVGGSINMGLFSVHPLILMIIIGIALQGLAECFLSPKFLEYASKQAPKGEVGLYLGYQHLTTFFAWLLGFIAAGLLLNEYCPDPRKLDEPTRHEWRQATDPTYEFTLNESLRPQLGDQIPMPASIRQALREHALSIPETARLSELKPRSERARDPSRRWRIEEPLFTIILRRDGGGKPVALKARPTSVHAEPVPDDGETGFLLPTELHKTLQDDEPIADPLQKALAERGTTLPEGAKAFKVEDGDKEKETWKIALVHGSIEEAKLETDADARAAGRERANRDVLVHGTVARSTEQMGPLPAEYENAHYIWFAFTGIGVLAFFAMLVFKFVTNTLDMNLELPGGALLNVGRTAVICTIGGALGTAALTWALWSTGALPRLADFLTSFLPGYGMSWPGALIGVLWGALIGLVGGGVLAGLYNTVALRIAGVPRQTEA